MPVQPGVLKGEPVLVQRRVGDPIAAPHDEGANPQLGQGRHLGKILGPDFMIVEPRHQTTVGQVDAAVRTTNEFGTERYSHDKKISSIKPSMGRSIAARPQIGPAMAPSDERYQGQGNHKLHGINALTMSISNTLSTISIAEVSPSDTMSTAIPPPTPQSTNPNAMRAATNITKPAMLYARFPAPHQSQPAQPPSPAFC